jgi:hypothetical protein
MERCEGSDECKSALPHVASGFCGREGSEALEPSNQRKEDVGGLQSK